MKKNFLLLPLLWLLFYTSLSAQNTYDIVMPNRQTTAANCQRCLRLFQQKPEEVRFSIQKDEEHNLWFEITDKQWFDLMFQNAGDGIAIDIVARDRYACGEEMTPGINQIRGDLQPPVYTRNLKSKLRPFGDRFRAPVGKLPADLQGKELEYNILFLNNRHLCMYYTVYNLEAYPWDLLDMGIYLDSVTYRNKGNGNEAGYAVNYKTLDFQIPFKKNKSEYSAADIKPVYDSLRITDFNIKKIEIQAYSSVEGSLERNIELQEQRAASILKALQSFQEPQIITRVNSSENWVEFLQDIERTDFEYYKSLSKKEAKERLTGAESAALEPILKNHRKALIRLSLEKKNPYRELESDRLISEFNTSVTSDKIDEAGLIQNILFERLMAGNLSAEEFLKIEIPNQKKYVGLLNKQAAMPYLVDQAYLLITFKELQKLQELDPDDAGILYNKTALKFKIWQFDLEPVDENKFMQEIKSLEDKGIAKTLVDRMLINYYIIKSENYMKERNYAQKKYAVAKVLSLVQTDILSDEDYLSVAQYLVFYSDPENATELLKDRVRQIGVSEDLLFYYLNLTLVDEALTQTSPYRTIMLNAYNRNQERFCKLFDSSNNGGVTFQLLEDPFLRNSYCENCKSVSE